MLINGGAEATPASKFMCGVVEGFYGRPWTMDQRKRLFQRMNKMEMDTYLYAPKDDSKHRMFWRDLYTVEESEHLTALIHAAEEENVTFVYALSPGLDITYSSGKELTFLKRKLEQVSSFGCKAFALLFDDIDIEMCEGDKTMFQSFAQAQVSVTNEVYQHLNQPEKFLFCPTEYCATRAVPDVLSSEYLVTIGAKLLNGIDVMWTGPKVVSKKISIKSIEELAKVLQRPPVIWDNIHANDYDQRRLFLGPYEGRSSELIPYLKGVLTNPNCEFEANFIAMHTLSQWSKSNIGGTKKDFIISESPVTADIKLETEGEYATDEDTPVNSLSSYQPRLALSEAIKSWLDVLYDDCSPSSKKMKVVSTPISVPVVPTTDVENCSTMTSSLQQGINSVVDASYMQPCSIAPVNSLVDPSSDSDDESAFGPLPEPMDCAASTSGGSICSSLSTEYTESLPDSLTEEKTACSLDSDSSTLSAGSDTCSYIALGHTTSSMEQPIETMQIDSDSSALSDFSSKLFNPAEALISDVPSTIPEPYLSKCTTDEIECSSATLCSELNEIEVRLTEQDLSYLVELFYMPFEHGTKSVQLLNEFHWLKISATCLYESKNGLSTPEQQTAAEEWQARATDFCKELQQLFDMFGRFCSIPNKALLCDLFPYVWDITVVLNQIYTFISWLGSNIKYQGHFSSGEQEPWVFRGGLQAEFQRMLPLEGSPDLLLMASPVTAVLCLHKIRPYCSSDKEAVYEVCRRTCDDGVDGTEIFPEQPDLIGDKLVGAFLDLSPDHCFVIEDDQGVCGYVLASVDAGTFHKNMEVSWLPAMQEKYPKPLKEDDLTPAEEIINSFHNPQPSLPVNLTNGYPAKVRMDIIPERATDSTVGKRAMASVVTALKISNVPGIHTVIHVGDHNTTDFYTKLGLIDIALPDAPDDLNFMGRLI